MLNRIKCPICGADFTPERPGQKKCALCEKEHPNADTWEEAAGIVEIDRPKQFTKEEIKEIVYEALMEAGIVRRKCEKCGKLFFAKSPAQKYCGCQKID